MGIQVGIIKRYGNYDKNGKKYGFILGYDGNEIFLHENQLLFDDFSLTKDSILIFNTRMGKKGFEAVDVQLYEYSSELNHQQIEDELINSTLSIIARRKDLISIFHENLLVEVAQKDEKDFTLAHLNQLFQKTKSLAIIHIIRNRILENYRLIEILPVEIKLHPLIIDILPIKEQIRVKLSLNEDISSDIISQIEIVIKEDPKSLKTLISDSPKKDSILSFLKPRLGNILGELNTPLLQLTLFGVIYEVFVIDEDIIDLTIYYMEKNSKLIKILPNQVKTHPKILSHINHPIIEDNKKASKLNNNNAIPFWQNWYEFSWQEKVLCVYRATYENINLFEFYPNLQDPHPLVRATLIIYSAKYKNIRPEWAFEQANELILDFVANLDWVGNEHISLVPFLPTCYQGTVLQCEGKAMVKAKDKSINAFCNYSKYERRRCPLNPDDESDLFDIHAPPPNMGDIPF